MSGVPASWAAGQPGLLRRIKARLAALRRRWLPYLVWHGRPVWVVVTFPEARLPEIHAASVGELLDECVAHLSGGYLAKIERDLAEIGVEFDKGAGYDGRDWHFDWSLRGPVEVRFVGR